jgi:hypothetical protein
VLEACFAEFGSGKAALCGIAGCWYIVLIDASKVPDKQQTSRAPAAESGTKWFFGHVPKKNDIVRSIANGKTASSDKEGQSWQATGQQQSPARQTLESQDLSVLPRSGPPESWEDTTAQ